MLLRWKLRSREHSTLPRPLTTRSTSCVLCGVYPSTMPGQTTPVARCHLRKGFTNSPRAGRTRATDYLANACSAQASISGRPCRCTAPSRTSAHRYVRLPTLGSLLFASRMSFASKLDGWGRGARLPSARVVVPGACGSGSSDGRKVPGRCTSNRPRKLAMFRAGPGVMSASVVDRQSRRRCTPHKIARRSFEPAWPFALGSLWCQVSKGHRAEAGQRQQRSAAAGRQH